MNSGIIVANETTGEYPKANDESEFEVEVDEADLVTITRYVGNKSIVVIPKTINGLSVFSIGRFAFYRKKIERVVFPDSLSSIEAWAFAECSLRDVTIPLAVVSIGERAFSGNRVFADNNYDQASITSLVFEGEFPLLIGDGAFAGNAVKNIVIPSVREIHGPAFDWYSFGQETVGWSITIGKDVFFERGARDDHLVRDSRLSSTYSLARFYRRNDLKAGVYTYMGDGEWSYAPK
jgi:hypothetical protein